VTIRGLFDTKMVVNYVYRLRNSYRGSMISNRDSIDLCADNLKYGDCKTFDTNYIGVNEHKIVSSDC